VADEQSFSVIENVIRREGRSLIQYVIESYPWTADGEQSALELLQITADQERECLGRLMEYLFKHKGANPQPAPYPVSYTTMNYISLEHLLPILTESARQASARIERDLAQVSDREGHDLLSSYLALKRQHAETLSELAAAHPETASTRR
jgi:hypothetical protein